MYINYKACPKNEGSNLDLYWRFFFIISFLFITKLCYKNYIFRSSIGLPIFSVKKNINTIVSIK